MHLRIVVYTASSVFVSFVYFDSVVSFVDGVVVPVHWIHTRILFGLVRVDATSTGTSYLIVPTRHPVARFVVGSMVQTVR